MLYLLLLGLAVVLGNVGEEAKNQESVLEVGRDFVADYRIYGATKRFRWKQACKIYKKYFSSSSENSESLGMLGVSSALMQEAEATFGHRCGRLGTSKNWGKRSPTLIYGDVADTVSKGVRIGMDPNQPWPPKRAMEEARLAAAQLSKPVSMAESPKEARLPMPPLPRPGFFGDGGNGPSSATDYSNGHPEAKWSGDEYVPPPGCASADPIQCDLRLVEDENDIFSDGLITEAEIEERRVLAFKGFARALVAAYRMFDSGASFLKAGKKGILFNICLFPSCVAHTFLPHSHRSLVHHDSNCQNLNQVALVGPSFAGRLQI